MLRPNVATESVLSNCEVTVVAGRQYNAQMIGEVTWAERVCLVHQKVFLSKKRL